MKISVTRYGKGHYALFLDGVCYAVAKKGLCTWRYEDATEMKYCNTLTECKEHMIERYNEKQSKGMRLHPINPDAFLLTPYAYY